MGKRIRGERENGNRRKYPGDRPNISLWRGRRGDPGNRTISLDGDSPYNLKIGKSGIPGNLGAWGPTRKFREWSTRDVMRPGDRKLDSYSRRLGGARNIYNVTSTRGMCKNIRDRRAALII